MFPSSEIYGGLNGFWDYGPLGVEFKRNIREAWWRDMVTGHDDLATMPGAPEPYEMTGLDCTIIMHPQVWKCSGHYDLFHDMMVDCRECQGPLSRGSPGDQRVPSEAEPSSRRVREMPTHRAAGVQFDVQDDRRRDGRPRKTPPSCARRRRRESSSTSRTSAIQHAVRIPFGIAQIGKSFRNEITPRNFTFRSREFEQMEIEFFCHPGQSPEWYQYWRDRRFQWYTESGPGQRPAAAARSRQGGTEPLFLRHGRHRVRVPVPRGRASSANWKASPIAATSTCAATWKASWSGRATQLVVEQRRRGKPRYRGSGKDLALLRRPDEGAIHSARDRAVGRRRSGHAGVPLRGVQRGRGARRERQAQPSGW